MKPLRSERRDEKRRRSRSKRERASNLKSLLALCQAHNRRTRRQKSPTGVGGQR